MSQLIDTKKSSLASHVSVDAVFVTPTRDYISEEVCEEVVKIGISYLVVHIHRIGDWVSRTMLLEVFSNLEDAKAFALDQVA